MDPLKITPSITQRDELTTLFFNEIDKYDVLDPAEERRLVQNLLVNGAVRDEARTKLVVHNIRFAISVAKKYCNLGIPFIDLINEACIGLCKACDTFDPSRECKFLTHAVSYMRGQILEAIEKHGKSVTVPHDIHNYQNKYRRLCDVTYSEDGRKPTIEEFADFAGISLKKAKQVVKSLSNIESLDAPINGFEDEDFSLSDTIVGGVQDETAIDNEALHNALVDVLTTVLSERDAKAVMAYFGLSNQTLNELSFQYGTTYEAIRKAIARAIERIRKNDDVMSRLQEFRIAA